MVLAAVLANTESEAPVEALRCMVMALPPEVPEAQPETMGFGERLLNPVMKLRKGREDFRSIPT